MRIIKETAVDELKVTVFAWNNKYLIKYENGWHEITYKINQLDITQESDIDIFLSDKDITQMVRESFDKVEETVAAFFNKI